MDHREARRVAVVRESFLRLMPAIAEVIELDHAEQLTEHTGRWINEIVAAYTAFVVAPADRSRAEDLVARVAPLQPHLADHERFVGGVIDPRLVSPGVSDEPGPDLDRLRRSVEGTWQRARRLASGEERPVLAARALEAGDAAAAEHLLTDYATDHPTDPWAWLELGRVYALGARHRLAVETYQRVVALADLPGVRYRLALALWQDHDQDGALREFRLARSEAPEHAEAWHNEALVLRELGRAAEARSAFEGARATYRRRLAALPDQPESLLWLAATEAALGEEAKARRLLVRALELDPSLDRTARTDPDLRDIASTRPHESGH